jgi:hypothetical protein
MAGAEEVAELVVTSTEPRRWSDALEAAHRPVSTFDAAMILLQSVGQVAAGPVLDVLAELTADGSGIAVVPLGGDPCRRDGGHRLSRAEGRFGAAMSRVSLSITSTTAPERSIAR